MAFSGRCGPPQPFDEENKRLPALQPEAFFLSAADYA